MPIALILIEFAVSYILNRLTQPNGPRLKDLSAGFGDYGVALPWLFGSETRTAGVVLAGAKIKETVHKKRPILDYLFGVVGLLLPKVKTYTYSITFAVVLADRSHDEPIEGLLKLYAASKVIFNSAESVVLSETLDANGRLVCRKYGNNKYCKSVTVYGGGFDQVADPVLEAAIGDQPGYRGWAYAVVEDLQLKDFGNTPPMPVEALTKVKTNETLASACETICRASGIDATLDLSSTALVHDTVRGYSVTSDAKCWDALKPLLAAFGADLAEVAGQLRFYKRSQSLRATIPVEHMGSYVFGDNAPDRYELEREPDYKLPRETALTFVDPAREYQPNTASSKRSEGSADSNVNVNIPLVLTADEGATAAAVMHWDAWNGRMPLRFTLTDVWNGIEPGRAYAVPIAGQYVPYRITRKLRGVNGLTEVEAVSDEAVTYTAVEVGTSGEVTPPNSTLISDTTVIPIDGPIVQDSDDEYGFYVAVAGGDPDWSSADLEVSADGGATYHLLEEATESAITGAVTGTLAEGPTSGLDNTLDATTVLTVELLHDEMELESVTDDELDLFANLSLVGHEYLQFKTATHITGSIWELTNLRRGRKGTDWALDGHAAAEQFVLLTGGGVIRLPATTTDNWGVELRLRGVTFNQDEADAAVVTFTNTGEGKRPYSPVNVEGEWDGANNLTISWDARSRLNAGGLGIDDEDNFEVEILSGSGTTLTATATTSVDYSAIDQTGDGITPGDSITGRVRQLSDVNDGRWRDFFLPGPGATLLHMEDGVTPLHLEDGITPFELG